VVSLMVPLWSVHYLLFSLPGLPLLLAGFVPGLNSRSDLRSAIAFAVPVLLVGALGLPAQVADRDPVTGHGEDLRGVSDYLRERALPGDAVLFVPAELRVLTEVSPEVFATLGDVAVDRTPREAGNLAGTPVDAAGLPDVLLPHQRAWLVEGLFKHANAPGNVDDESLALLAEQFERTETRTVTDVRVTLYIRR
jgi:mannosyltransferase